MSLRAWRVLSRYCPPMVYAETFEEAAAILGEQIMEEDTSYGDKQTEEAASERI